ncbi:MAG: Gfo/Idh/MocA family oxidoreductase [Lachnospiraceae bacterium]|nr:Gfo/Idh/MocA family oxidoreductase [Lachnospiraceae bacterium]
MIHYFIKNCKEVIPIDSLADRIRHGTAWCGRHEENHQKEEKEERMMKQLNVGVVGVGAISDIYFSNMIDRFKNIHVISCCARHLDHAQEKAEKYGIQACTYEEMLKNPEIDIVVVLTGVGAHYELIRDALEHGKHVFTEKTMTLRLEEARELSEFAEKKSLYFCSAPETFLGAAFQTGRKAIEEGMLGEIYSFHISENRALDFLAAAVGFLRQPGGGLCQDYGVYYLTALCSLFGGVNHVYAVSRNNKRIRINPISNHPDFGKEYIYDNDSQVAAVISMRNGMTGTFALHGDSAMSDLGDFMIYGTQGILKLSDANQFGGETTFIPLLSGIVPNTGSEVLPAVSPFVEDSRGIGVSEMADAILKGRKSRLDHGFAYHVFEVIDAINGFGKDGGEKKIFSPCERPAGFSCPAEWAGMLDE